MAGDGAIARLRQYLGELQPPARALLAAELERALLRGEEVAGASFILEELRRDLRGSASLIPPRAGHPQRLFCAPLTPFLIDQGGRRYLGRISRACLDPVWRWLCREVVPDEAKAYEDEVNLLLAADDPAGAGQVARRFQDVVLERLRETLAAAKSDEKTARRLSAHIGLRDSVEDLRRARGGGLAPARRDRQPRRGAAR
jgi:hypothetical protein